MPISLSCVSFLNALPYVEGLRALEGPDRPELLLDPPFRCADRLRAGSVDGALVPSIEFATIPGAVPAGSLGIASREEVRSVILLTRRPPGDLERVAVDSNSRTSVALLRLVLARLYGCRPRFEAMEPDSSRMLASHGAALLIGDAALRASRDGVEALDLAAAWHRMTGLPFVFALWGARDARMAAATADLLERSLPIGLERIRAGALAGAAAKAGVDEAEVLSYLTRNIHYRLGPEEQESLSIYLALCREEGVLEGAVSA